MRLLNEYIENGFALRTAMCVIVFIFAVIFFLRFQFSVTATMTFCDDGAVERVTSTPVRLFIYKMKTCQNKSFECQFMHVSIDYIATFALLIGVMDKLLFTTQQNENVCYDSKPHNWLL